MQEMPACRDKAKALGYVLGMHFLLQCVRVLVFPIVYELCLIKEEKPRVFATWATPAHSRRYQSILRPRKSIALRMGLA